MIDGLRRNIISNIEGFDGEQGNHVSDIIDCITSTYYPDILGAFREIEDMSHGKNEDGSYYFLPFRVDSIGEGYDSRVYTAAFTYVNVGDEKFAIEIDSCVKDDFNNVGEFVDEIMRLTEEAERVKKIFNSLRPIYNVGI